MIGKRLNAEWPASKRPALRNHWPLKAIRNSRSQQEKIQKWRVERAAAFEV
jgi:hypothetical protein